MAHDLLFKNPDLYDFIFRYDLENEISLLSNLAELKPSSAVLLPACGTGRYGEALVKRVRKIVAFDLEKSMIEFAKKNCCSPSLEFQVGNMTWFSNNLPTSSFDSALLLNNSLRYLLRREQAGNHLRSMNRALKIGAHYVLELGINETDDMVEKRVEWSASTDELQVDVSWTLDSLEGDIMKETIEISLNSLGTKDHLTIVQEQLRWTPAQLIEIATASGFQIHSWTDRGGRPLQEADLEIPRRVYLTLKKEDHYETEFSI